MNRASSHSASAKFNARPSSSRKKLPTEKRSDWTFKTNERGRWVWQVTHSDGTHASSHRGFLTRTECVADATRAGYVAWIPEAERRTRKEGAQ